MVKPYSIQFLQKIHDGCQSHIWYGGEIVKIVYKDYSFYISAVGDVRADYFDKDGVEDYFVDKNNGGLFYNYFKDRIANDKEINILINNSLEHKKPSIIFNNNNWFECFVIDRNDNFYDLGWTLDSYTIYDAIDDVIDKLDDALYKIEMSKQA